MNHFAEPGWDLNITGENDPNKNDYEPAYSPDNDSYYKIFGDDDDDRPFYELGTYVVDDDPDPEPEPVHHKEEPDINGIYCFYEESELY